MARAACANDRAPSMVVIAAGSSGRLSDTAADPREAEKELG